MQTNVQKDKGKHRGKVRKLKEEGLDNLDEYLYIDDYASDPKDIILTEEDEIDQSDDNEEFFDHDKKFEDSDSKTYELSFFVRMIRGKIYSTNPTLDEVVNEICKIEQIQNGMNVGLETWRKNKEN